MDKFFSIFKIFVLICIFIFIKILSDTSFVVRNLFLFKIIEIILAFLLSFSFCIFFDYNKTDFWDKIISNFKVSILYLIVFTLFTILKIIFSNIVFIGILNYLSFILIASLLFLRDRFIYGIFLVKNDLFNIVIIIYFLVYKLILNTLNIYIVIENPYYNLIMLAIFVISIYFIKILIYAINLKGLIEYEGKEYPVYDICRVGYLKSADIYVDDKSIRKSIFFTINVGKKFFIRSNVKMQIDNNRIEEKQKVEINDGETIKCMNNYFTFINSKIGFLKKIILSLSLMLIVFKIDAKDIKKIQDTSLIESQEISIKNIDFSHYPLINIYINNNLLYENIKNNSLNIKKNIFIVEDEDIKVDIKEINIEENPIDIVFIFDVTGSMYDEYKKIHKNLFNFAYNIKKFRKKIRRQKFKRKLGNRTHSMGKPWEG